MLLSLSLDNFLSEVSFCQPRQGRACREFTGHDVMCFAKVQKSYWPEVHSLLEDLTKMLLLALSSSGLFWSVWDGGVDGATAGGCELAPQLGPVAKAPAEHRLRRTGTHFARSGRLRDIYFLVTAVRFPPRDLVVISFVD